MSTIEEALTRARLDRPYFARGLAAMHPVEADLETLAVDKHWRLYFNPKFLAGCTHETAATAVLHELEHLRRKHSARAEAIKADHPRWNVAGDAEINDDLKAEKLPFPIQEVQPATLGCKDGLTAEEYYLATLTPPKKGKQGKTCDGGSGAGVPQPWEQGAPGQPGAEPGLTEAEERVVIRGVAADVQAHAAKAPGSVSAELLRWAELELGAPVLPWQTILAAEVRRGIAIAAGRVDYSYARLSRRQGNREIRLPASIRPVPNVALVLDTSGSMGDEEGRKALGEVAGICRAVGADVMAISCDAEASKPRRVTHGRQFGATGGGGTDMGRGIEAAEKAKANLIVVLTDGETPWPKKAPRARVVVCLVAEPSYGDEVPAWAKVVRC